MSGAFFADPDAMDGAMDGAAAAADALGAAAEALASAEAMITSSLSWGFGEDARHKTSTFVRQWREEFGIVAELLVAFDEGVRQAAAVYREGENALTAALQEDDS